MEVKNFVEQVRDASSSMHSKEEMLGKGLNIPNNATNSGARKIMNGTHQSHTLVLSKGEVPYLATGYENRFGEKSSSIIRTDKDYEVIAKISKFSYAPNHHYYLILRDLESNTLHMIERISYKYVTETYGYLHNNSIMDSYSNPGTIIPKNSIIRRSTGFDQFGNKTNGCNVNVTYMALDQNMEDSVVVSDECAKKLSAPLLRTVKIIINENDIPLNIYGDDNVYKVYPDVGEDIKDGILMAYRREKREESIYTQSVSRLQQIMMSDDKITLKGKIIDIDIYCNNPEHIRKSTYNQQFLSYYNDRLRMDEEIVNTVGPYIAQGFELTYPLQKIFSLAKDELSGKKFIDKKSFSNIVIEFVVMENRPLDIGDKVADRYGGKGVISEIIPVDLMPKMPNGYPVDMIKNSSTMYNRENAGQIFELEINYISMNILDSIRNSQNVDPEDALDIILKFIQLNSETEYQEMKAYTDRLSRTDLIYFLESMLNKQCIYISTEPMSETMTIDKLGRMYEAFPWIKPAPLYISIKDSKGNYRTIPTRRPMIAAPQYCLRLKQFAEEKFSATSLSSTNIKNENAKSKASKNYREPNSNTPIKFGQMESGDFDHMGVEKVVINLMLHSLSPHGRRLVEQIATGDPYDVDVKLDMRAKNRSAEILNTRLKTMGYRMVFKKIRKIKKYAFLKPAIEFMNFDPNHMIPAIEFMSDDYDFDHWYKTLAETEEIIKKQAVTRPAIIFTESMDHVNDLLKKDAEEKEEKES